VDQSNLADAGATMFTNPPKNLGEVLSKHGYDSMQAHDMLFVPKPQPKPEVPTDIRAQLEEFKRKAAHNEQLRHEYLKEYHQAELADIPPYEEWLKQTGKQKLAEGGSVKKPFTSPKHSGYNIDHMRHELLRQG